MNSNNGKALKLHFITIISNIFIHQRLSRSLDLHSVIASEFTNLGENTKAPCGVFW